MLSIQLPRDLISYSIYNILSYRKDNDFYKLVKDWNKVIIINVKEFYPVTVIFQGEEIKIEKGETKKPDLKITMGMETMMDISFGRIGSIKATLKRKIKIKGMLKIGVLLRFLKIFVESMKLLAKEPNTNYYELEKCTK